MRAAGHSAGNYRRAGRSIMKRVCRDCAVARVAFAREQQQRGYNVPLDTHSVVWSDAARKLGIDISDLYRNNTDRRRREEQS